MEITKKYLEEFGFKIVEDKCSPKYIKAHLVNSEYQWLALEYRNDTKILTLKNNQKTFYNTCCNNTVEFEFIMEKIKQEKDYRKPVEKLPEKEYNFRTLYKIKK